MIDCKPLKEKIGDKPVVVFGLGRSGLATIKALRKADITVIAHDNNTDHCAAAEKLGAEISELTPIVLKKAAFLVLAPGVPLYHPEPHPVVLAAREADCEIIGDVELLSRCDVQRRTIGITGTNGKSTTAALVDHILRECGVSSVLCGNIGKPVMGVRRPGKDGAFVMELSSFQLDLCPSFTPDIAVLLNITEDHLDRHGSMEAYAASKARIVEGAGTAIIGTSDSYSQNILQLAKKAGDRSSVIALEKDRDKDSETIVAETGSLRGEHNKQNILAAFHVCRALGLAEDDIWAAVRTFPGLAHRQFPVRTINGVAYINDSKATNAEAAAKALTCHKAIYWIVGGKPKTGGLKGLEPYVTHIRHAFLIGEAADEFAKWMRVNGVDYSVSGTMESAVKTAHDLAQRDRGQPGGAGVVLLSPACASFDQYPDFEARGDDFTALVEALAEEPS